MSPSSELCLQKIYQFTKFVCISCSPLNAVENLTATQSWLFLPFLLLPSQAGTASGNGEDIQTKISQIKSSEYQSCPFYYTTILQGNPELHNICPAYTYIFLLKTVLYVLNNTKINN